MWVSQLWTNWNKAPISLWQTQLNFTVFCASSACGVSSAHLNYAKHPMIRAVYRFHIYDHVPCEVSPEEIIGSFATRI